MNYSIIETPVITTNTYNVDNTFYLVVPKMISTREIEIIIEYSAGLKMPDLSNTDKITIIRPLSKEFLGRLNELSIRKQLKALIQQDLAVTKKILAEKGIACNDKVSIKSFSIDFISWYRKEETMFQTAADIESSQAKPEQEYKETSDELVAARIRREELIALRDQAKLAQLAIPNQFTEDNQGVQSGKRLVKSNGQSLLPKDENGHIIIGDGFINILLLSFVTAFVTIGTVVAMLYILN